MLSKGAIAVAADKGLRKRLTTGVTAAGARVEAYASPGDVPKACEVDLVVVALGGSGDGARLDELAKRLKTKPPVIAVIPTACLDDTVALMQRDDVTAVLAADDLDNAKLANAAARLLFGDLFGLDKVVAWGVRVHAVVVGDYEEKSLAIQEISDFAERVGVRRKYRELIEQCLDEMLMNALYDAPVDKDGKPKFRSVPVKERLKLPAEEKAVVEYACDGDTFALSVRDAFGTLERDTVVWYLDKCLHAAEQIDRKEGGAGLGLYLIANASTQFFVNLHPGVATEAACVFDLKAPKIQLEGFGVFQEKPEAVARAAEERAAAVADAPAPRGLLTALATSVALILVLIGMVAYPRLAPIPRGDVRATTEPPGAVIEIDGRVAGTTDEAPVVIPDLEADTRYIVAATLDGYREALAIVSPREGEVQEVHLVLEREGATMLLESDPPGADVIVGGELRGRTPVEVVLPAASEHELRFERRGYEPVIQTIRVPPDGSGDRVHASLELAPGLASVGIVTDPPGALVRVDGEVIEDARTPIEELVLSAGQPHEVEVELAGYAPVTREVVPDEGERRALQLELERGARLRVSVNVPGARLRADGLPDCRGTGEIDCPAPSGRYRVRISSDDPFVRDGVDLDVEDEDVSRSIFLGIVETASERFSFELPGAPPSTRRAGLRAGERTVVIVDGETGDRRQRTVQVTPGATANVTWE
jgi:hypothetical protein